MAVRSIQWCDISSDANENMPRKDCTPDAPIPTEFKKKRKYSGPAKGSDEAKARMERVRAAQWAKHGLVIPTASVDDRQE